MKNVKKHKIRLDGNPIALEKPVLPGATPPRGLRIEKRETL